MILRNAYGYFISKKVQHFKMKSEMNIVKLLK